MALFLSFYFLFIVMNTARTIPFAEAKYLSAVFSYTCAKNRVIAKQNDFTARKE